MSYFGLLGSVKNLHTARVRRELAPPCSRGMLSVTLRSTDGETVCLAGHIAVIYDASSPPLFFTAASPTSPTSGAWTLHLPMSWHGLSAKELVSNLRSSRSVGT